jgi:hypothetical protein
MAVMISAGTPYFASALASASRWLARKLRPPSMRDWVMKIGR